MFSKAIVKSGGKYEDVWEHTVKVFIGEDEAKVIASAEHFIELDKNERQEISEFNNAVSKRMMEWNLLNPYPLVNFPARPQYPVRDMGSILDKELRNMIKKEHEKKLMPYRQAKEKAQQEFDILAQHYNEQRNLFLASVVEDERNKRNLPDAQYGSFYDDDGDDDCYYNIQDIDVEIIN